MNLSSAQTIGSTKESNTSSLTKSASVKKENEDLAEEDQDERRKKMYRDKQGRLVNMQSETNKEEEEPI